MAEPAVGDRVLLNVAALDRGLGTGGYALVIAVLDPPARWWPSRRSPPGTWSRPATSRCRPWWPEPTSRGRRTTSCWRDADSLDGLPVVVADLHSALAPTLLAVAHDRPGTRVVYVMTDQGALPLAFSRSVAQLRDAGLLAGTVTVGQAFGGDLEAVTVHSGLLAARLALRGGPGGRHPGPGQPGHRHPVGLLRGRRPARRSTRWRPSAAARSARCGSPAPTPANGTAGVSHHSLTAYGRVALCPADLAVPDFSRLDSLTGIAGLERWRRWRPTYAAPRPPWTGTGRCWSS